MYAAVTHLATFKVKVEQALQAISDNQRKLCYKAGEHVNKAGRRKQKHDTFCHSLIIARRLCTQVLYCTLTT